MKIIIECVVEELEELDGLGERLAEVLLSSDGEFEDEFDPEEVLADCDRLVPFTEEEYEAYKKWKEHCRNGKCSCSHSK